MHLFWQPCTHERSEEVWCRIQTRPLFLFSHLCRNPEGGRITKQVLSLWKRGQCSPRGSGLVSLHTGSILPAAGQALTASQGFGVCIWLSQGDHSVLAQPCWAVKGVHLFAAQFTTEHESHSCPRHWSTCSSISFVSNLALEQKEEV